jgi:hypothetical protein
MVIVAACGGRSAGPPGDCTLVAEIVTSFRLGNYAPVEQRAPIVDDVRARCLAAGATADETECVRRARDELDAKSCVRRMFPELASGDDAACARVTDKLRAAMGSLDARLRDWADEELAIEERACREDAWPDELKTCLLERAMDDCHFPASLHDKLQRRISAAFEARFRSGAQRD